MHSSTFPTLKSVWQNKLQSLPKASFSNDKCSRLKQDLFIFTIRIFDNSGRLYLLQLVTNVFHRKINYFVNNLIRVFWPLQKLWLLKTGNFLVDRDEQQYWPKRNAVKFTSNFWWSTRVATFHLCLTIGPIKLFIYYYLKSHIIYRRILR